jgi:hypothetical protein
MERRVRSMVTGMLGTLYRALVRLHPPAFRRSYGPEMLSIFDHTPGCHRPVLLGDATVSLLRQWLLRPEFHQPVHPSPTAPAGASMFRVLNDDPRLTPRQWISGAALSLLGWTAASLLIGPVTLHSLTMTSSEGNTSEQRRTLAAYFDSVRVLSALDLNRDLILSPSELANAPLVLRSLDTNHDEVLDAREVGGRGGERPWGTDFMRYHPVLAALDADHDGLISAAEIANAPAALATLDKNRDGLLTAAELLPVRNP